MLYPRISIITPSYNQVKYLEETISSVLSQNYPNLEYIIIDGGSTDGSLNTIKKYEKYLSYWVSEKDEGLYHALQKGFERSTGEIMGWINSDDLLHQKSLYTVAAIFEQFAEIQWIQGYPTVVDDIGRILYHRNARNSKYSFYAKEYHDGVFIQQESTYWRRSLWQKAGSFISQDYKFAGDFELWMRFFKHELLYNTDALIGAFRIRANGQLSVDNYGSYLQECDKIIDKMIPQLNSDEIRILPKTKTLSYRITQRLIGKKEVSRKTPAIHYNFQKNIFFLSE